MAFDQGLHCLLTECSFKISIKMKISIQQNLTWNRTGPIDKSGNSIQLSADPDQSPQNVASDQGLHCLLTEWFSKFS